jgi:N-acyl amino acid synthase FeeM
MIQVREALTPWDMERVWRLTHDEYVKMGYAAPQPGGILKHFDLDGIPETRVWLAEDEDGLVLGTISITMDGPAGLHVDDDFKDVVDEVREECRREGKRLGAPWRIVTRSGCHDQLIVSMGIIGASTEWGIENHLRVTLYTFNPRHERFYRRVLGLRMIAGPRPSPSVQGAPAILMRGDLETLIPAWTKIKSRRTSARRAAVIA